MRQIIPLPSPFISCKKIPSLSFAVPEDLRTNCGPCFQVEILPEADSADLSLAGAIQIWGLPTSPQLEAIPEGEQVNFCLESSAARTLVRSEVKNGFLKSRKVIIWEFNKANESSKLMRCSIKPLGSRAQQEILEQFDEYSQAGKSLEDNFQIGIIETTHGEEVKLTKFRQYKANSLAPLPRREYGSVIRDKSMVFYGERFSTMIYVKQPGHSSRTFTMTDTSGSRNLKAYKFAKDENGGKYCEECSGIFQWLPEQGPDGGDLVFSMMKYNLMSEPLLTKLEQIESVPADVSVFPEPYFKLTAVTKFYGSGFYAMAIQLQGLPPCPELQALSRRQRVTIFFETYSGRCVLNSTLKKGKLHCSKVRQYTKHEHIGMMEEFAMKVLTPEARKAFFEEQSVQQDTAEFSLPNDFFFGLTKCYSAESNLLMHNHFPRQGSTKKSLGVITFPQMFQFESRQDYNRLQPGHSFTFRKSSQIAYEQTGNAMKELEDSLSWDL